MAKTKPTIADMTSKFVTKPAPKEEPVKEEAKPAAATVTEKAPEPKPEKEKPAAAKPAAKTEKRREGQGIGATYLPEKKSKIEKRPHSVDKETGEAIYQVGFFISERQDNRLSELSREYGINKSAMVRKALDMYIDLLDGKIK